jgi:hypothetical protein
MVIRSKHVADNLNKIVNRVALDGCHRNLVYGVVSWIPVLGNLWEVPVEGSHMVMSPARLAPEEDCTGQAQQQL